MLSRMPIEARKQSVRSAAAAAELPQSKAFLIFATLLSLAFAYPLIQWARFALNSGLFSYVLLVPFISGYFAWLARKEPAGEGRGVRWPAVFPAAAGVGFLAAAHAQDAAEPLTLLVFSYCCLMWGGCLLLAGTRGMRRFAFAALFLAFMTPIPRPAVGLIESFLQHASADVSYLFIKLSGIPIFRSGMNFHMPGIALAVGPECSGIRSSLVLFLASLVAGQMLLRSRWTRWTLALIVIPLGIVRNAFRILVIAWLCVKVDVAYLYSPIHNSGGPLFFALSLIPFGVFLLLLRRAERSFRSS